MKLEPREEQEKRTLKAHLIAFGITILMIILLLIFKWLKGG